MDCCGRHGITSQTLIYSFMNRIYSIQGIVKSLSIYWEKLWKIKGIGYELKGNYFTEVYSVKFP